MALVIFFLLVFLHSPSTAADVATVLEAGCSRDPRVKNFVEYHVGASDGERVGNSGTADTGVDQSPALISQCVADFMRGGGSVRCGVCYPDGGHRDPLRCKADITVKDKEGRPVKPDDYFHGRVKSVHSYNADGSITGTLAYSCWLPEGSRVRIECGACPDDCVDPGPT